MCGLILQVHLNSYFVKKKQKKTQKCNACMCLQCSQTLADCFNKEISQYCHHDLISWHEQFFAQ